MAAHAPIFSITAHAPIFSIVAHAPIFSIAVHAPVFCIAAHAPIFSLAAHAPILTARVPHGTACVRGPQARLATLLPIPNAMCIKSKHVVLRAALAAYSCNSFWSAMNGQTGSSLRGDCRAGLEQWGIPRRPNTGESPMNSRTGSSPRCLPGPGIPFPGIPGLPHWPDTNESHASARW
eukprot:365219-Chlamydomonas_euryale.AAC.49